MNQGIECEKQKKHIAAQKALRNLDSAISFLEYFVKCLETGEQERPEAGQAAQKPATPNLSLEHFLSEVGDNINTHTERIRKVVEEATQKLY